MSAMEILSLWAGFCASLVVLLPWPWGLLPWVLLLAHVQIERWLNRR